MLTTFIIALAMQSQTTVVQPNTVETVQEEGGAKAKAVATKDSGRKIKIGRKLYAPEDIVCKRQRVTGSRVKKRLCNTARQWELLEQNSQSLTDEMRGGVNNVEEGG